MCLPASIRGTWPGRRPLRLRRDGRTHEIVPQPAPVCREHAETMYVVAFAIPRIGEQQPMRPGELVMRDPREQVMHDVVAVAVCVTQEPGDDAEAVAGFVRKGSACSSAGISVMETNTPREGCRPLMRAA